MAKKRTTKSRASSIDTSVVNDDTVALAAPLIARHCPPYRVRQVVESYLGRVVSDAQWRRLNEACRERMAQVLGQSRDTLTMEAAMTYYSVMNDPESEAADVIRAQQGLNELFGLGAKYMSNRASPIDAARAILDALSDMESKMIDAE